MAVVGQLVFNQIPELLKRLKLLELLEFLELLLKLLELLEPLQPLNPPSCCSEIHPRNFSWLLPLLRNPPSLNLNGGVRISAGVF